MLESPTINDSFGSLRRLRRVGRKNVVVVRIINQDAFNWSSKLHGYIDFKNTQKHWFFVARFVDANEELAVKTRNRACFIAWWP